MNFDVHEGQANLNGQTKGLGYPIVFLHAGVGDSRMFASQLDYFSQNFQTISYDRRGYGRTQSPDEPFSHVEDLTTVLNFHGIKTATLVGCSQGGRIAIDFSLAHPQRVKSLVLVSTAISGEPSPTFTGNSLALIDALNTAENNEDLEEVNRIEAHMWLDGPESKEGRVSGPLRNLFLDMNQITLTALELTHEIEPPNAIDRLGEILCPVLLINGNLDFPHIQERHKHLNKSLIHSQLATISDTAHLPNLEKPDKFNQLLTDFIEA